MFEGDPRFGHCKLCRTSYMTADGHRCEGDELTRVFQSELCRLLEPPLSAVSLARLEQTARSMRKVLQATGRTELISDTGDFEEGALTPEGPVESSSAETFATKLFRELIPILSPKKDIGYEASQLIRAISEAENAAQPEHVVRALRGKLDELLLVHLPTVSPPPPPEPFA